MKFFKLEEADPVLIPLIGFKIPAGFPSPAMDYLEDDIDMVKQLTPRPLSTFFGKCEGDSMIGAFIPPGAILAIDKSLTAKSGDIVVAYVDGGFTVKFLQLKDGKCFLVPANKNYAAIEITAEREMFVWGVVTNVVIDTKFIRLCMPL